MTFLSPSFMFVFLPVALGIYALLPGHKKADFLPIMGAVFFVCVNINDPFAIGYIVMVALAVVGAVWFYKKTRKRSYLYVCSAVCFVVAAIILKMRIGSSFSMIRCRGIIMCLMAAISLCLDISRGEGRVPSLWSGLSYVTYFPVILAGPFVSYSDFISRLDKLQVGVSSFSKGAILFLKGFIKAVLIGSVLSGVFTSVLSFGRDSIGVFFAILLAALQSLSLYAFFSGYSDIARGISCMMGIELDRDMGDPFANSTPTAYLRGFFKGFSVFFRKYITNSVIGVMGENLLSRGISAALSAMFLLLLFCQNLESLLVLIPFAMVAEYFVLFVRPPKNQSSLVKRIFGAVCTFFVMSLAWAVVSSNGVSDMVDFCRSILTNPVFYISHSTADELLNLKFIVLPVFGAVCAQAAEYIFEKWDDNGENKKGYTFFKCITAAGLLIAFCIGVVLLLPQFPGLSSDVFGANFI